MQLPRRKRVLLSVLQELGGELDEWRLQSLLYLFCKEGVRSDDYFEFVSYGIGPHSIQATEDKISLIRRGILVPSDRWSLAPSSIRYAVELDFFEKIAIQELKNRWHTESDDELKTYVSRILEVQQTGHIEPGLFTIGYEGASPEAYVNALLANEIRLLVDVRKNAFSQKFGFSKSELERILSRSNIEYRHMPELGIDSGKRKSLVTQRDYDELFEDYINETLPRQTRALDTLSNLVRDQNYVAITCFEADPVQCHRRHVAHALACRTDFPYRVEHLMPCKHQRSRNAGAEIRS